MFRMIPGVDLSASERGYSPRPIGVIAGLTAVLAVSSVGLLATEPSAHRSRPGATEMAQRSAAVVAGTYGAEVDIDRRDRMLLVSYDGAGADDQRGPFRLGGLRHDPDGTELGRVGLGPARLAGGRHAAGRHAPARAASAGSASGSAAGQQQGPSRRRRPGQAVDPGVEHVAADMGDLGDTWAEAGITHPARMVPHRTAGRIGHRAPQQLGGQVPRIAPGAAVAGMVGMTVAHPAELTALVDHLAHGLWGRLGQRPGSAPPSRRRACRAGPRHGPRDTC